jgi:hypothetical protein
LRSTLRYFTSPVLVSTLPTVTPGVRVVDGVIEITVKAHGATTHAEHNS